MGAALWRHADERLAEPEPEPASIWTAGPGCRFRIEVFGRPRAPWRSTPEEAMQDAIRLDLASWDESRKEYFLAVPVDMNVRRPQ